jgi:hypothetical protein
MEEPSKLPSMSKLRATVDSIDEYSFCSDTDAEQRKAFLNAPFASECKEISVAVFVTR